MSDAGALTSVLIFGGLLGMKHALEADHVAAVAALATRSRTVRDTVRQGVLWGTGHMLTLLVFGAVVLTMHAAVPERLAVLLELAVGVMLIVLGIDVLMRLRREKIHFHAHRHADGVLHVHAHSHAHDSAPHDPAHHVHAHPQPASLRALFVGMMHGMSGTAALILVSAGGTGSVAIGLAEIAVFGAGAIVGMAALSVIIALPLRFTGGVLARTHNALQSAVGVATLAFGCVIAYRAALQSVIS
jgi:sulfite exporter TauE/SafE